MVNEASLTTRQKESLFWKKKLLLHSRSSSFSSEQKKSGFISSDLAREILAMFREGEDDAWGSFEEDMLLGDEFDSWPDSESGTAAYMQAIVAVLKAEKSIGLIINRSSSGPGKSVAGLWISELISISQLITQTLDLWFLAAGIDRHTGDDVPKDRIKDARLKLSAQIQSYKKAIFYFRRAASVKVCALLKQHPLFSMHTASADVASSDDLKALIEMFPEAAGRHMPILLKLKKEYLALKSKSALLLSEMGGLKDLAEKLCDSGNTQYSEGEKGGIRMAVSEYEIYIREQLQGIHTAVNFNLYYASFLMTGRKVGLLVANYVKEHYGSNVEAESIYDIIEYLPSFVPVHTQEIEVLPPLSTMDEFRAEAALLLSYKNAHEDQFENQLLISVLLHLEGLPQMAGHARNLRNSISKVTKTDMIKELSPAEQDELLEIWIFSDVMTRIAFLILEYVDNNHRKAMIDLVDTFPQDLYEMSYLLQEKVVRKNLTQIFERRKNM